MDIQTNIVEYVDNFFLILLYNNLTRWLSEPGIAHLIVVYSNWIILLFPSMKCLVIRLFSKYDPIIPEEITNSA